MDVGFSFLCLSYHWSGGKGITVANLVCMVGNMRCVICVGYWVFFGVKWS